MHELAIAQALVDQVGKAAEAQKAKRVVSIRVVVGTLSGVDPESLRMAFPLAAEEEPLLKDAVLVVEPVTATVRCADCQAVSTPEPPFVYCMACKSRNVQIETGRELYIQSAEIETEA